LLIWPPDFEMRIENGTIEILNRDGEVVAHIGDRVQVSGGEIHLLSMLDKPVQEQVPPQCAGPYWIVGDEVITMDPPDFQPTLSPDRELRMSKLLQAKDCQLPCYLGITPGKTSWTEARQILTDLGAYSWVETYGIDDPILYHLKKWGGIKFAPV
jgi:hypothetical protein